MNKIRIVENKPTIKEATTSSLSMEQVEAIYKILAEEFGEEHIKDMFTLGDLSLYNLLVKGGVAGIQENINGESYTVAGKSVTLNKGQKSDGTDWTVTFQNGKKTSLSDVLSLINPFPKGITKESIDEQPDVLNKIADMMDRKYPHLKFDIRGDLDRIDVRGSQSDLMNFGDALSGQKIFDYEIFHIEDDDRGEIVRIIKSSRINEEKPGLWANIRAKQARGEKPARKGSKAYKIAKAAGDEINKEK